MIKCIRRWALRYGLDVVFELDCVCCWAVGCGPFVFGAVGSEKRETEGEYELEDDT